MNEDFEKLNNATPGRFKNKKIDYNIFKLPTQIF